MDGAVAELRSAAEEEAIEATEAALGLAPEDVEVRHQLAAALLARGRRGGAVRELERVLMLAPAHANAELDLAVIALADGDAAAAAPRLDRVLARNPEDARALYHRALAHERLGDRAAAIALLERVQGSKDPHLGPRASAARAALTAGHPVAGESVRDGEGSAADACSASTGAARREPARST